MPKNNKNIIIVLVAFGIIALAYFSSGERVGDCTIRCDFKKGNIPPSIHGPYGNYSKAECEEKVQYTEIPATTCHWEWESD